MLKNIALALLGISVNHDDNGNVSIDLRKMKERWPNLTEKVLDNLASDLRADGHVVNVIRTDR